MAIVTSTPKSKSCCVYKITFPDGYFYIGSTANFSQRLSGYKYSFKGSIGSVNILLARKYLEHGGCEMNIVIIVDDKSKQYELEDVEIKKESNNPFLLNRSRSAFSNLGMVKNQTYVV